LLIGFAVVFLFELVDPLLDRLFPFLALLLTGLEAGGCGGDLSVELRCRFRRGLLKVWRAYDYL
jgi:hypothetical protein